MKEFIVIAAFVISILAANLFPGPAGQPPEAPGPQHVAEAPHGHLPGPG